MPRHRNMEPSGLRNCVPEILRCPSALRRKPRGSLVASTFRWKITTAAASSSAAALRNLRLEDADERTAEAGDGTVGGPEVALAQPPAAVLIDVGGEAVAAVG